MIDFSGRYRLAVLVTTIRGVKLRHSKARPAVSRGEGTPDRINRPEVVRRHNPSNGDVNTSLKSPFSVGSGRWAATVDITGAQTFNASCKCLNTLSDWQWHTFPPNTDPGRPHLTTAPDRSSNGTDRGSGTDNGGDIPVWPWSNITTSLWDAGPGRPKVPYYGTSCSEKDPVCYYLISNPHRWNLGKLGW